MNKTGVALLSALLTAGVGVGSLAIMNQIPATSNMLNTAFGGDKQIVIEKEENSSDKSFSSVLDENGYALVNYFLDDEITSNVRKIGTATEFMGRPRKDGYAMLGWSKTPDGKNMVANIDGSCDLYPVYVTGDFQIKIECEHNSGWAPTVSEMNFDHLNYQANGFSLGLAGISKSREKIECVTELEPNGIYYGFYYCTYTDSYLSLDDTEKFIDYMNYGEPAFYNVTLNSLSYGTQTGELRLLQTYDNISIDYDHYSLIGYATAPDSIEVVEYKDMVENGVYYGVYHHNNYLDDIEEVVSYNYVNSLFDIVVTSAVGGKEYATYEGISNYETDVMIDKYTFRFIGWSVEPNSTIIIDYDDIVANNVRLVYGVYVREDTGELFTLAQYNAIRNDRVTRVYTYNSQNLFVHYIESYEEDAVIGDVTYEFVGWSESADSTDIITGGWEEIKGADFVYAVYRDTTTGELLSRDAVYDIYYENRWN